MNTLYPIFLKTEHFQILIVGGGYVGTEKITFLLKSSPNANIMLVAPEISSEILDLQKQHPTVQLYHKPFEESDLEGKQLVIAGTSIVELNQSIWRAAKARNILVNVADTPELCDFYLGSIVTKGDLKIGISTNGKSPTFAKRFREFLEEVIPDNITNTLEQLNEYRKHLKGDLVYKMEQMQSVTQSLLDNIKKP